MSRFRPARTCWVLALLLGLFTAAARAQEYRYHYVDLDAAPLPQGYVFFQPATIVNSGSVFGTAYDADFSPHVAVYAHGVVAVLQDAISFAADANQGQVAAGGVLADPVNYYDQAALFRGSQVELIPRLPGELSSDALKVNDAGAALVGSFGADYSTLELYRNGAVTPLDFGPQVPFAFFLDMNNQDITGTTYLGGGIYRGFRFDPRTGQTALLNPLPTEPDSWALGINNRCDVLGYSFIFGATERIGVWDKAGAFQTYFVEGTPQVPTISNFLLFNDNNLIVITEAYDRSSRFPRDSYLVPRPGVRLSLSALVDGLPAWDGPVGVVTGVNNHGDLIGYSYDYQHTFLLERTGAGG